MARSHPHFNPGMQLEGLSGDNPSLPPGQSRDKAILNLLRLNSGSNMKKTALPAARCTERVRGPRPEAPGELGYVRRRLTPPFKTLPRWPAARLQCLGTEEVTAVRNGAGNSYGVTGCDRDRAIIRPSRHVR